MTANDSSAWMSAEGELGVGDEFGILSVALEGVDGVSELGAAMHRQSMRPVPVQINLTPVQVEARFEPVEAQLSLVPVCVLPPTRISFTRAREPESVLAPLAPGVTRVRAGSRSPRRRVRRARPVESAEGDPPPLPPRLGEASVPHDDRVLDDGHREEHDLLEDQEHQRRWLLALAREPAAHNHPDDVGPPRIGLGPGRAPNAWEGAGHVG